TGGTGVAMCGRITCDCTYQGRNLWGNVTYVANSFDIHDFDVELTTNQSDSDLKVQEIATTGIANMCGQWKIVTATSSPRPFASIATRHRWRRPTSRSGRSRSSPASK